MDYSFENTCDRRGTGCIKWDSCPDSTCADVLPMWIADMEFSVPDFVLSGIKKRLEHPVFGYFEPDSRFYRAIENWHRSRYGSDAVHPEHIYYQHSVLGSIATALQLLTDVGDEILVQAPGYAKFREIIIQHGRKVVMNPLCYDGERYRMDFENMEAALKEGQIKVAIFCSPNNPTGRVWEREELLQYIEVCKKYQVTILADEIWADFSYGRKHIPLYTVAGEWRDRVLSFYSPTKTFNLAGLVISYAVIFDKELGRRFQNYADATHYNNCNALSVEALIAAYEGGAEWVEQLNAYIKRNVDFVEHYLREHLPEVRSSHPEGTYLIWLDFKELGYNMEELVDRLVNRAGVIFNDGRTCIGNGDFCMRMNAAAPRAIIEDCMERILHALKS